MGLREERKLMAQETISIAKERKYILKEKEICLEEMKETKLMKPEDIVFLKEIFLKKQANDKQAFIQVFDESVVDAVIRMNEQYEAKEIGVLLFASAYHAGGGFLNGAIAQEECIAYVSDIYLHQTSEIGQQFYETNKQTKSKMYTDTMLFSEVTFFRNGAFELLEDWKKAMVLTAPAVNMGAILDQKRESVEEAKMVMKNRMRNILMYFVERDCKALLLGAFGCGVFRNDAEDIARYWQELLYEENFISYFEAVDFSVIKGRDGNFEIFQRVVNSI